MAADPKNYHDENCIKRNALRIVYECICKKFSCGHTQDEHNRMHNLHMTANCEEAGRMPKKADSRLQEANRKKEELDKKIAELTKELREIENKREVLSMCQERQDFYEFVQKSKVKFKAYHADSYEFICGCCGHEIPEKLLSNFIL